MTTWEGVHAGDIVRGHDGKTYGVIGIDPVTPGGPVVALVRHGAITGPSQVPPGVPIEVVEAADVTAEAAAFAALQQAGLAPVVIRETYQP